MSGSDVSIVAFGRPECDDAQSHVLSTAAALGAATRLVTSSEDEDFSSMDHGSIDWRDSLDGAHWFVTSASTAIEGEAARFAWGAGMTFGELEGVRTVMIADLPEDHSRLAECWGAVIERIRQITFCSSTRRRSAPSLSWKGSTNLICCTGSVCEDSYLTSAP